MGDIIQVAKSRDEARSSTPTKNLACSSRHPFSRVPAKYTTNYFKHRLGGLTQLCRNTKSRLMALRLDQTGPLYKNFEQLKSSVESLHMHHGPLAPATEDLSAPTAAQFWNMAPPRPCRQTQALGNPSVTASSRLDQSLDEINLRGGWGSPTSKATQSEDIRNGGWGSTQPVQHGNRGRQNQRPKDRRPGRIADTSRPRNGRQGNSKSPPAGGGWGYPPPEAERRDGQDQGGFRWYPGPAWANLESAETPIRPQESCQSGEHHSPESTSEPDVGPTNDIKWNDSFCFSPPFQPRHSVEKDKEDEHKKYPYRIPRGTVDHPLVDGNGDEGYVPTSSPKSDHDCWGADSQDRSHRPEGLKTTENAHQFGCGDATLLVTTLASPTCSAFRVCHNRMAQCALRWNVLQDIDARNTWNPTVTYIVDTYNGDVVEAMRLFLGLLHNQYDSAEGDQGDGHLSLRQLALLTQFSSYFGTMAYISSGYVFYSQLDMLWEHGFDNVDNWDLLLFVCREFRTRRELYAEVAAHIAFYCELTEDGDFALGGLEPSVPLASIANGSGCPTVYIDSVMVAIHEQIKMARHRAVTEIFSGIGSTMEMLTAEGENRGCRAHRVSDKRRQAECEALHLGFLLKGLASAQLWPLPEVDDVTMSVKALLSAIQEIDAPRFSRIHLRQGDCRPLQKLQKFCSSVVERLCKEIDFPQTE